MTDDRGRPDPEMQTRSDTLALSRRGLLRTMALGAAVTPLLGGLANELLAPPTALALDVGARLPPFTLRDLRGRNFQSSALRGKVAFIDIWASWCEPCADEFPVLNRLHDRYAARGLEIVAISVDSEASAIRGFLRRIPARFRVLHDGERAYVSRLNPRRMPSSYIVDRRGIVRYVHGGFRAADARAYEREIRELIAG